MKKSSKLAFLFCAYFMLMIVDGCNSSDDIGHNCGNSNYIPFYDFGNVHVNSNLQEVDSFSNLEFEVSLKDIEYLAYQPSSFNLGLINKATACSLAENGSNGLKFPIEKIEIFSDQDFNDIYPSGTPLNGLIEMINNPQFSNGKIPLIDASVNDIQYNYHEEIKKFIIETRPTELNISHQLTVVIYKSNGETVEASLDEVVWK